MRSTRRQAAACLKEDLKPYAILLDETFSLIDLCIDRLETTDSPFGRVCALTLVKARNLTLGCYSLSLDALGQEAGALLRPLIECLELLTYFRLDPTRAEDAIEERLPGAGDIARRIEGKFGGLRKYLNKYASHLSLAAESCSHLIDFRSQRIRLVQTHRTVVLRENLRTILAILMCVTIEAANCVSVNTQNVDHALADTVDALKSRILMLLDKPVP